MIRRFLQFVLLGFLASSSIAFAQEEEVPGVDCPSANVFGAALVTGVCWSCMLPVSWGNTTLGSGDNTKKPSGANTDKTCKCIGDETNNGALVKAGLSVGAWFPTRIIEQVKRPYCFPSLFGKQLDDASLAESSWNLGHYQAESGSGLDSEQTMKTSVHLYSYPLLQMLQIMDIPTCVPDYYTTFDLLYLSEAFPNFNSSQLAFLVNPEALLFANPLALSAQALDCSAVTGTDRGLDQAFWVAGCWGGMYPLVGSSVGMGSKQKHSSLVTTKFLYMLARLSFVKRTVGKDALCEQKYMPMMKKSQFRFQQIWPMSESKGSTQEIGDTPETTDTPPSSDPNDGESSVQEIDLSALQDGCCHALGQSTFTWGEWRNTPGNGNYVYILWQYVDCCVGLIEI